jgi:hypothetical protein
MKVPRTMAASLATLTGAVFLACACLAGAAHAQGTPAEPPASSQPSEAERLVFLHEHLGASRQPRVLRYAYVAEAAGQPQVNDRAVLTLANDAAGKCCQVHGDYLSGAMTVNLPDIPDARANPVVLYFLEGEVRLLQRTTAGQAAHFRRRIRQALADTATVSDTTVQWGGRSVPARTVRVTPYLDDPYRARFAEQATTEYSFVLADAVPGGVYAVSATVPAQAGGSGPLARRSLTIEDAK